jgi:hypothetical protein
MYQITFNGRFFREDDNGYGGTIGKVRLQKKIQNMKDCLLIFGTILAGVGSIALVSWEIYKEFCLH